MNIKASGQEVWRGAFTGCFDLSRPVEVGDRVVFKARDKEGDAYVKSIDAVTDEISAGI